MHGRVSGRCENECECGAVSCRSASETQNDAAHENSSAGPPLTIASLSVLTTCASRHVVLVLAAALPTRCTCETPVNEMRRQSTAAWSRQSPLSDTRHMTVANSD